MGANQYVSHDKFPSQAAYLGKRVLVLFNFHDEHTVKGTVVRDDKTEPWMMLIRLDDGRYINSTECQYQLLDEEKPQEINREFMDWWEVNKRAILEEVCPRDDLATNAVMTWLHAAWTRATQEK